jgi:hypothetical protein
MQLTYSQTPFTLLGLCTNCSITQQLCKIEVIIKLETSREGEICYCAITAHISITFIKEFHQSIPLHDLKVQAYKRWEEKRKETYA